jgi:hypothetical protein
MLNHTHNTYSLTIQSTNKLSDRSTDATEMPTGLTSGTLHDSKGEAEGLFGKRRVENTTASFAPKDDNGSKYLHLAGTAIQSLLTFGILKQDPVLRLRPRKIRAMMQVLPKNIYLGIGRLRGLRCTLKIPRSLRRAVQLSRGTYDPAYRFFQRLFVLCIALLALLGCGSERLICEELKHLRYKFDHTQ